ncbi:MAG: UvrB/UvrC motif-containing protein, partial [Planctomycetes bacterium]|nr:UvrB/UvrC motif-containing protein [Planctomycetota bacterium]
IKLGDNIPRNKFLQSLVSSLYSRNEMEFAHGNFRVKGDTVDIYPAYADVAYRIIFWGDEIETIETFNPISGHKIENYDSLNIYPANIFITSHEKMKMAVTEIQGDMIRQAQYFKEMEKHLEAKRLEDRVTYDIEMMRELGYCSGIENYSRYFDGRAPGTRPYCLIDYFPDDFLMVIDESHVTVPQVRAMYGGDRSRKQNLVEYGFRLPAAMDNRPLKFPEFEAIQNQVIYVSATPSEYELQRSEGVVVEQLIRPTGLLDPIIEIRPSLNQIDDLLDEIDLRIQAGERILVTTLTKRMAEELTKYLLKLGVKCRYIHSEVDTLDRVEIMRGLRLGDFDVLVGVNLLREGLDLPEVSLVAILDADKEGFLRSEKSLTQTAGRAARNINSKVIFYADKITNSMQKTMDETERRRAIQLKYNEEHNITPTQIIKSTEAILGQTSVADALKPGPKAYVEREGIDIAADPLIQYMTKEQLEKVITKLERQMKAAVKELDFIEAARFRDEIFALRELVNRN